MADTAVFKFQVDGLEETIVDFATLDDVLVQVEDGFVGVDDTATNASKALDEVGKSADDAGKDLKKAGKEGEGALEGLNVELLNSNARLESLQSLTDGVATTFAGATATFVSFAGESPRLQKLNERVGALSQTLGGVVALTNALGKENRAAITALIGNFKRAGLAVRAFASTTRGALISTGVGALVVAIGLIVANFDKVKAAVQATFSALGTAIQNAFPPIKRLVDSVKGFVSRVGGIGKPLKGHWQWLKTSSVLWVKLL